MLTEQERKFYETALRGGKEGWEATGYGLPVNQRMRFEQVNRVVWEMTQRHQPEYSILDVGCGVGDLLPFLAGEGMQPMRFDGIDVMPEMVAQARERIREWYGTSGPAGPLQWDFQQGTLQDWVKGRSSGSYDVVSSVAAFALKPPEWGMHRSLQYVQEQVMWMHALAKHAVVCTLFSPWKTEIQPEEMVVDPGTMFGWAMQTFGRVEIVHSYCPFDFALVIWKGESAWQTQYREGKFRNPARTLSGSPADAGSALTE